MPALPPLVLTTAGHVDHGKSTLVRALTGTDPDRFAEEHRRGMSLDLGFAFTTLDDGRAVAFVDVPGHARFVRTMLAGAGSVDAALLVVDAGEGWMPQSEEHLAILELLDVPWLVVAVTKAERAGQAAAAAVGAAVRERLAASPWPAAPILLTDATAGTGLDQLRRELACLPVGARSADEGRPRLWIDRAFTIRGAGTVVTGTLTGGTLAVGDALDLLPAGRAVRVRGLQTAGAALEVAHPGTRVALNLHGVEARDVARGDALVRAAQWHAASIVDASLRVLASHPAPVARRGAHLLAVGSAEHAVQVRVLGAAAIAPGASGLVRLHLPVRLPLVPGDRFVLRDAGRGDTVGGGEVLDVDPLLPASRAAPDRSVERVVAEHGWITAHDLERRTGRRCAPDVGTWVVDPDQLRAARAALEARLAAAGATGIDVASLDERAHALLTTLPEVTVRGTRAVLGAHDPLESEPWLAALRQHLFDPPPSQGVAPGVVRDLVATGRVVALRGGVHVAREAIETAAAVLAALTEVHPDGVTVAQARDALGSSRRVVVPLLEHLEAAGHTRRHGDRHLAI